MYRNFLKNSFGPVLLISGFLIACDQDKAAQDRHAKALQPVIAAAAEASKEDANYLESVVGKSTEADFTYAQTLKTAELQLCLKGTVANCNGVWSQTDTYDLKFKFQFAGESGPTEIVNGVTKEDLIKGVRVFRGNSVGWQTDRYFKFDVKASDSGSKIVVLITRIAKANNPNRGQTATNEKYGEKIGILFVPSDASYSPILDSAGRNWFRNAPEVKAPTEALAH